MPEPELPPARLAAAAPSASLLAHARHARRRALQLARPLGIVLATFFVFAYLFGRIIFFIIATAI